MLKDIYKRNICKKSIYSFGLISIYVLTQKIIRFIHIKNYNIMGSSNECGNSCNNGSHSTVTKT